MHFDIKLHRHGVIYDQFTVKARKAGLVGIYHDGAPYLPDDSQVLRGLPYRFRRAFDRAGPSWWADMGLSDVVRCDLWRKADNAPMGSILARLVLA